MFKNYSNDFYNIPLYYLFKYNFLQFKIFEYFKYDYLSPKIIIYILFINEYYLKEKGNLKILNKYINEKGVLHFGPARFKVKAINF